MLKLLLTLIQPTPIFTQHMEYHSSNIEYLFNICKQCNLTLINVHVVNIYGLSNSDISIFIGGFKPHNSLFR